MNLSFVHLHLDCQALQEGAITAPPKFDLVARSEDGHRLLLQCSICREAAQLTLIAHTPDNPPEGFPVLVEEIADAPERPPQSADPELGGGTVPGV